MANTQKTLSQKTLSGVGNLIRLLPTGTVFLFQFLNPVFTNDGECHTINKYLSGILIGLCGFSCVFSSFTDSYTDRDGKVNYGVVTSKGFWPEPADKTVDLSSYRLRFGDFVHAAFALLVFAALVLLDTNSVRCFYPGFESTEKVLLQALPPVFGAVSSSVFVFFPNNRHGIGYPSSDSSQASS